MRLQQKSFLITAFSSLLIFSPNIATADISDVKFAGASVIRPGEKTTTTATDAAVFGGVAGSDSTCSGTDVCNNCHGTIQPCNDRRITPSTIFTVTLKTDKEDSVKVGSKLLLQIGDSEVTPDSQSETLAVKTELFATFAWSKLCATTELGGSNTCSGSDKADVTAKIGFDVDNDGTFDDSEEVYQFKISLVGNYINDPTQVSQPLTYFNFHSNLCGLAEPSPKTNDGFCHFTLYKGDEKAYIENGVVYRTYNKTATTGINYSQVRFYYEQQTCRAGDPTSFDIITLDSPNYTTSVHVSGDSYQLVDGFVSDLTNNTEYVFKMANIDDAGNVFLFSPHNTPIGGNVDYLNCTDHSVVPEEVMGLIDSNGCFIATAAYGSTMAKEIDVLREFRSKILLKSSLGKYFTKLYYTYSPDLALKLKKHPTARAAVRYTLWPIVNFAKFVLWSPLLALSLFASLGMMLLGIAYFALNNKRGSK